MPLPTMTLAAMECGLSLGVLQLIERGIIPAIRSERRYIIKRADLEAFLAGDKK